MKQRKLMNMFFIMIFTLGIYAIYLVAKQNCELASELGEEKNVALQVILIFLTIGIWGVVLMYKSAKYLNEISNKNNMNWEDLKDLVLCLTLIGAQPVCTFLYQDKINTLLNTRG